MKKPCLVWIIACFGFGLSGLRLHAENLSYPFEAITISEAKTFDILIPETLQETSLLYGLVEEGDILTVYVATIWFTEIGGAVNPSPSKVLILTNDEDVDIVRFVVNSAYQVIDVESFESFASHILIDATMGVFKDLESIDPLIGIQELTVHHVFAGDQLSFVDNTGLVIPMIAGTYALETGLDIVISMNAGDTE